MNSPGLRRNRLILITFFLMLSASLPCISQVYVEGVNINDLPVTFVHLNPGPGPWLDTRVYVRANYGQVEPGLKNFWITDEYGKRVLFNSEVDALNHMASNGWKYLESMILPDEDFTEKIYVFERIPDEEKLVSKVRGSITHKCFGFIKE